MSPGLRPLVISLMPGRTSAVIFRILSSASTFVPSSTVSASTIFTMKTWLWWQSLAATPVSRICFGPLVPFVQIDLRVVALEGEHLVRVEPHGLLQVGQLLGIGELQRECQKRDLVPLGVPVAVVDLQAGQAVHRVVLPLLDVREKDHAVVGGDRVDEVASPSGPSG